MFVFEMHLAPLDQSLSCRQSYRQERPLVPSQRAHLLGASLLAHHQLLLRARHAHHRVCRVQPRRCPSVLSFKNAFNRDLINCMQKVCWC